MVTVNSNIFFFIGLLEHGLKLGGYVSHNTLFEQMKQFKGKVLKNLEMAAEQDDESFDPNIPTELDVQRLLINKWETARSIFSQLRRNGFHISAVSLQFLLDLMCKNELLKKASLPKGTVFTALRLFDIKVKKSEESKFVIGVDDHLKSLNVITDVPPAFVFKDVPSNVSTDYNKMVIVVMGQVLTPYQTVREIYLRVKQLGHDAVTTAQVSAILDDLHSQGAIYRVKTKSVVKYRL